MKTPLIGIVLIISSALLLEAAQPKPNRVPPPGITIAEKDRAELRAGTDALAKEIASLRTGKMAALLPDVEVFHKAVDWALRYDEFYRSNEVGLARGLLKTGLERAKQLREGKPTWLSATGLVVRGYRSKIDGSVQPYGLVVPATFAKDKAKPRRLDVWLHGRDDKLTELKFIADRQRSYGEFTPADAFVLHPYGRYCNAFKFAGETDVFEALDHVKKSYAIDERRLALRGFSMGGAGAWHLGAHHPDVWAVVSPGAGFAETAEYTKANRASIPAWEQTLWQLYDATDYAANFATMPVVAYNGTEDPQRQAADVMERAMKAEGLTLPRVWGTNVPHKWTPEAKREVSGFVDAAVGKGKEQWPERVHFTSRTLRYHSAPGVKLIAVSNHWQRADFDFDRTMRRVRMTNVTTFALDYSGNTNLMAFDVNGDVVEAPYTVGIPGNPSRWILIGGGPRGWVTRNVVDYPYIRGGKSPGVQGPIDDVFMDKFLMVRPTGKPQNEKAAAWIAARMAQATNDWRAQFRGDVRVKDDVDVNYADLTWGHLVLWGDPQSNRVLQRFAAKLPIKWNDDSIKVGTNSFSVSTHVPVFICANPGSTDHYIVVNSGFTFAAAGSGSNAQQTPKLPDYAVLDITDGSIVLADFFDEQWRIK